MRVFRTKNEGKGEFEKFYLFEYLKKKNMNGKCVRKLNIADFENYLNGEGKGVKVTESVVEVIIILELSPPLHLF